MTSSNCDLYMVRGRWAAVLSYNDIGECVHISCHDLFAVSAENSQTSFKHVSRIESLKDTDQASNINPGLRAWKSRGVWQTDQ
jgi:hypothetical protein